MLSLSGVVVSTGANVTEKVGLVVELRLGLAPAAGQLQLSAGVPEVVVMLQPGRAVVAGVKPALAS